MEITYHLIVILSTDWINVLKNCWLNINMDQLSYRIRTVDNNMSRCLLVTDKKHCTDYKFSKFTMISYIMLYSYTLLEEMHYK